MVMSQQTKVCCYGAAGSVTLHYARSQVCEQLSNSEIRYCHKWIHCETLYLVYCICTEDAFKGTTANTTLY